MAKAVQNAIDRQVAKLSRYDIIQQSLVHSRIFIVDAIEDAITISNIYAPEHLILQVANRSNMFVLFKTLVQCFWVNGRQRQ